MHKVAAPGIDSTPTVRRTVTVAGHWVEPLDALKGDRAVTLNGRQFRLKAGLLAKFIVASGGVQLLHLRDGRRAYVLSSLGMFAEDDDAARRRANPQPWQAIPATAFRL